MLLLFLSTCDTLPGANEGPTGEATAGLLTLAAGDVVTTKWETVVYSQADINSTPVGVQPAGSMGVVENGPKAKAGFVWYRVDFDTGADGLVLETDITGAGDPPPPPPPLPGGTMIGALGCSMTRDLMQPGLYLYSALPAWQKLSPDGEPLLTHYSGGTVARWADESGNNIKWAAYEGAAAIWPPTFVLWQICIREDEITASAADYDASLAYIYDRMRLSIADSTPVYVTPMPTYEAGWECGITGPNGVGFAYDVAARAAQVTGAIYAEGLALGPLGAGTTIPDGCHANQAGAELEAGQFVAWYEALNP